ncbi:efflux RND transporter periplasmic adaptor subunit [Paraburkholderia sediminicola]|uniref:efflux RND transporter periplasmic adaptor subunit n=1 Tax=Paraburkholderia sediminicola TaxID=458836 RepID=UPI0038B9BE60
MSQPFNRRVVRWRGMWATRRSVILGTLLVGLLAACLAGVALHGRPATQAQPPAASALTVSLAAPYRARLPDSVAVSGSIAPWQEASIRSLLAGARLAEIRVDTGSTVRRGQLLARYDTTMLQADVAQAAAALAQAKAAAEQGRANEERALEMKDSGGISKQDLLQYRTTAAVTRAQEEAARAQLQARRIDLHNADVIAPDDGTISARSATLGSVAPVGQELFRLIRQDRLQWQAEVAPAEVASIATGQRVVVRLPDGSKAGGTVVYIAPALDTQSHVAIVYADLEAGSHARAGMYVSGQIVRGDSDALLVPGSALAMHDGRSHVAEVVGRGGEQRVTLREVQTGRRDGRAVEIVSGLSGSERLVADGASLLNEGDVVTVIPGNATLPAALTGTLQ